MPGIDRDHRGGEIDEYLFRKMATRFLVDIIRHVGWYKAGEGAGFIGAIVGAIIVLVAWG